MPLRIKWFFFGINAFPERNQTQGKHNTMENTTHPQASALAGLPDLNVGEAIINDLQEEGRTVVWLAKKIGMGRASIYYHLNADSFSLEMLWKISLAMKHNYLADYSTALGKQISSMSCK